MSAAQGRYSRNLGDRFQWFNSVHMTSADAFMRENLPRAPGLTSVAIATTGVLTSARIHLEAGITITNIEFSTGGTAGATMTNWWVALYDDSATPALLRQSADQTSGAIAANTNFSLALASTYVVPRTAIYRAAIMVAASTIPTLLGMQVPKARSSELALAHSSGSGLTTTAPSTIASPTELNFVPRFVLS